MPKRQLNVSKVQEDYLETILQLTQDSGEARVTDIAGELSVRKSTVTLALRALAEKGLIYYQAYTSPTLTNEGHTLAANVRYRHNILQHFLGDILQVSEERAEQNACRIEHAIDRTTLARLAQFLGFLKSHPVILGEWLPKDEQADRGSGGSALRKKGTDECR